VADGSATRRVLLATHSAHKLRELQDLLDLPGTGLISLGDAEILDEATEDGSTFEENARLKAWFYAARSGLPTLADDSGLEVDALGGGPGVRTRRYAGDDATDEENNAKLLAALAHLEPEERTARYRCALVFVDSADAVGSDGLVTQGTLEGRIAQAARGSGGFGYDPIFEPAGEPPGGRTVAELTREQKNRISHRAIAAGRMAALLRKRG